MCRLIVLSALVACALAQTQAGVPKLDSRIVGGGIVSITSYPYQVSLLYYSSHICGGSIISANHVVTAAHCTDGSAVSSLQIRAGSSIRNFGGQVRTLGGYQQHPYYISRTLDFDISVLELLKPLDLGDGVLPINLPGQSEEVLAGVIAHVTGWGALFEGGFLTLRLHGVDVPIVSRKSCRAAYGSSSITDRMICAGFSQGGRGVCYGDAGGPLVAGGKLVGIVSWGYGCARPSYPGVYTNVAALRNYIQAVSGI